MKIQESQGIVTDEKIAWDKLCSCIVEYIYDFDRGLNANPFNEDISEIYLKNIISYYKYQYGILNKDIVPSWIGDFEIEMDNTIGPSAWFEKSTAKLIDSKLVFKIKINDYKNNKDKFYETLIHEFRHAYTTWIEKTKGVTIRKPSHRQLYVDATNSFRNDKFDNTYSFVERYEDEKVILKNDIYQNANKIEHCILKSFYYIDIDEINSFLQEYGAHIKKQLLNDKNYSYYDSSYYRIYASYFEFWNNLISNIDDMIIDEVVQNIKDPIKRYLNIDICKSLVTHNRNSQDVIKKLAKKQIMAYEKVLKKMRMIYYKLQYSINDEQKQNMIINKETSDKVFGKELLDLFK